MYYSSYRYRVNNIIDAKNNNIDLIRLLLSIAVIWGHSSTIRPVDGYTDLFFKIFQTDISGVAVWIFFFLSGLLVSNSLLIKKNITHFICARIFRIYPALLINLALVAYIIGPLITILNIDLYFENPATSSYILNNATLHAQYWLPGIFENNYNKSVVNGSLWTIRYEVFSYATIILLFIFGFFF